MVDTKGRTVQNDEADKTSGGTQEAEAEAELKESIRLNTFRIYSLQEMQDRLQKEMRRAIANGADTQTISAIQDEWNRNIRDYKETVNRITRDLNRAGEVGKEAVHGVLHEVDPLSQFRGKDVRKYLEARARALRAALGKLIKDLRAKNEQREEDVEKAVGGTARTAAEKAKEFTAGIKEVFSHTAAAYYSLLATMEKTFEKRLDKWIEELKKQQQEWEQKKAETKEEKTEKDPVDLDQGDPANTSGEEKEKTKEKPKEKEEPEPDTEPQPEPQPEPVPDPEPQPEQEPLKPEPVTQPEPVNQPPVTDMPEPVNNPANPTPLNLEGLEEREDLGNAVPSKDEEYKNLEGLEEREDLGDAAPSKDEEYKNLEGLEEREDLGDAVSSKNTEEDAMQPKESAPLTPESLKRLQEMMMLNGLKDEAEKNGAEYTGKAEESAHAAKDAAKEAEQAKRAAERDAEQAKVDKLHGLTIDEAEKKILAGLREQAEAGEGKEVVYQDFDRDGDGKMDTRFSIVPKHYQQWNYDNILKDLVNRKAKGEQTAGIDVNDKRYVNGISKDEPIDLAIAKATKRANDTRENLKRAAQNPDIQDDKNYNYFISVEDLGIGKDGKVHGGSRNVQFGDEGFAHETASNEEVRGGLFQKLNEYIGLLGKEGKMLVEKDKLWQENHPILASAREKGGKAAVAGLKKGVSKFVKAFEEGAR